MPADVIVTIRMPASLTAALKKRRDNDYYTDLSEQVRSIVRKGSLKYLALLHQETDTTRRETTPTPLSQREEKIEALLAGMRELLGGGK